MAEEVVTISKFKATCLALMDKVKKTGKPILVTRRNEPIALITPPPKPKQPAGWLGMFKTNGRIVGDMIAPVLDESEWEVLEK